jgi:aspartyl-tRNA(Asn)/glutamyl-tRNA(Gln) amidotransferase subunit C
MARISREEMLHIARMSQIQIHENEIEGLINQVQQVLTYAERVTQLGARVEGQQPESHTVNVFRDDEIIPTNPAPLLAQAPELAGNYFVVPRILESNE